jgi:two-component system, NtrC family, sensor kinase
MDQLASPRGRARDWRRSQRGTRGAGGAPGVFSTGLLGAFLMLGTGHAYRLERLVDDRTRDLQVSTQRLKIEMKERGQAQAALHQAQRMKAIGQLTGGIAHDFNNLLMVMSGSVERLRGELSSEKSTRFLDMIGNAAQRGEGLTRQLLSFSQLRALKPRLVDLAPLLRDMTEMLKRSLRGDIEIKIDVPDAVCAVEVDPGELELAILNVAVNARDAMPKGGTLMLAVDPVTLHGEAEADGLEGEYIAIRIADSGIGIPADALARAFEPFFTTKEVGKGSGLGLSHVYGFAKQSGGSATISSTLDQGTTVTLYLPRSREVPIPASAPPQTEKTASGRGTVLVVDDNADVAAVCTAHLEELGYRVECVSSGGAAFESLATNKKIRLVLSDILMSGGVDGLQLARHIRDHYHDIGVVLTTGYSGSVQDALHEGFLVLKKPFDIAALAKALEEVLKENELQRARSIAPSA